MQVILFVWCGVGFLLFQAVLYGGPMCMFLHSYYYHVHFMIHITTFNAKYTEAQQFFMDLFTTPSNRPPHMRSYSIQGQMRPLAQTNQLRGDKIFMESSQHSTP